MRGENELFVCLILLSTVSCAQEDRRVCVVYFTGIGCPHCAETDPIVLGEVPLGYNGSVVVIEYEIYRSRENARLLDRYNEEMGSGLGVPQLVFDDGIYIVGDRDIKKSLDDMIVERLAEGSMCPVLGSPDYFEGVDLNNISGEPKIWFKNRILFREGGGAGPPDELLKQLLLSDSVSGAVSGRQDLEAATPQPATLSGSEVRFSHAVKAGGWVLEWNDEGMAGVYDRVEYTSVFYYLTTHIDDYVKAVVALGFMMIAAMTIKERKNKKK